MEKNKVGEKGKIIHKLSRRKKIIKVRLEINKIRNKSNIGKSMKLKVGSLERSIKLYHSEKGGKRRQSYRLQE